MDSVERPAGAAGQEVEMKNLSGSAMEERGAGAAAEAAVHAAEEDGFSPAGGAGAPSAIGAPELPKVIKRDQVLLASPRETFESASEKILDFGTMISGFEVRCNISPRSKDKFSKTYRSRAQDVSIGVASDGFEVMPGDRENLRKLVEYFSGLQAHASREKKRFKDHSDMDIKYAYLGWATRENRYSKTAANFQKALDRIPNTEIPKVRAASSKTASETIDELPHFTKKVFNKIEKAYTDAGNSVLVENRFHARLNDALPYADRETEEGRGDLKRLKRYLTNQEPIADGEDVGPIKALLEKISSALLSTEG